MDFASTNFQWLTLLFITCREAKVPGLHLSIRSVWCIRLLGAPAKNDFQPPTPRMILVSSPNFLTTFKGYNFSPFEIYILRR